MSRTFMLTIKADSFEPSLKEVTEALEECIWDNFGTDYNITVEEDEIE